LVDTASTVPTVLVAALTMAKNGRLAMTVAALLTLDGSDQFSEALTDGQHLDLVSSFEVSQQGRELFFEFGG